MFMEERQREICQKIETAGKITIAEITKAYHISEESARRDLRLLEQKGLCKRTHGGAIRLQQVSVRPAPDRDFRQMPVFPNYRQIARRAAEEIRPHDVVYLTGGSFGYIMTEFLPRDFPYTLVVNSVDVGARLRELPNADIYLAGGKMRQSGSLTDSLAADFVSRIHFDRCFLTGAGLTAGFGLSNGTNETAAFQRAVLKNSRARYLLIPSAKIGTDSFIKVCDAEALHTVVTDWDCMEEQVSALEEKGLRLIVVEEPA